MDEKVSAQSHNLSMIRSVQGTCGEFVVWGPYLRGAGRR